MSHSKYGKKVIAIVLFMVVASGIGIFIWKKNSNQNDSQIISVPGVSFKNFDDRSIKKTDGTSYVDSQLLITAESGTPRSTIETLVNEKGAKIVGFIELSDDYQIEFDDSKTYEELNEIIDEISSLDYIYDVGLHKVYEIIANSSYKNDPWDGDSWDEGNPGGGNWGMEAINMPSVWDSWSSSKKIKVGVYDRSFDKNNKDLMEVTGWIFNNVDEENDHGTMVASILGAEHGNKIGMSGIVPNAELYCFAFGGPNNSIDSSDNTSNTSNSISHNTSEYTFGYATPMEYKIAIMCMLLEEVKVINFSNGFEHMMIAASNEHEEAKVMNKTAKKDLKTLNDSMSFFLKKCLDDKKDFVIVKGAGNCKDYIYRWNGEAQDRYSYGFERLDTSVSYESEATDFNVVPYAQYDIFAGIEDEEIKNRVIIVGNVALNEKDLKENKYKFSRDNVLGDRVDVLAPGEGVYAATLDNEFKIHRNGGTSAAAPHVAGVAALLWERYPQLTGDQVKKVIKGTADIPVDGTSIKMINAYGAIMADSVEINKIATTPIENSNTPTFTDETSITMSDSDIFNEFLKDKDLLIGTTYENTVGERSFGSALVTTVLQLDLTGTINTKIADFDNDGQDELLILELQKHENQYGAIANSIKATMYENSDGEVLEAGNCILASGILESTIENTDVFIKNMNGTYIICCESELITILLADGMSWSFNSFIYSDNEFTSTNEYFFAGSGVQGTQQSEIGIAINEINDLGLTVNSIIGNRIVEQDKSTEVICHINAKINEEDIQKFTQEDYTRVMQGDSSTFPPIHISIDGNISGFEQTINDIEGNTDNALTIDDNIALPLTIETAKLAVNRYFETKDLMITANEQVDVFEEFESFILRTQARKEANVLVGIIHIDLNTGKATIEWHGSDETEVINLI